MAAPLAPTVAQLVADLGARTTRFVARVGLLLDAPAAGAAPAATTLYARGLRVGLEAILVATARYDAVADADVALLSRPAVARVLDEAERFVLSEVLAHWAEAERAAGVGPLQPPSAAGPAAGTLATERRAIQGRLDRLDRLCAAPYREPAASIVVNDPAPDPRIDPASSPWRGPWGFRP